MWNYGSSQDDRAAMGYPKPKNKGLAILFGLMPGAGHMYLAKMKRGMTLLILFWGDIALAAAMGMSLLLMALPVLWFYSFFDNLNLASLSPEEQKAAPDPFFFGFFDGTGLKEFKLFRQRSGLLGWGCILIGGLMLFNSFARGILQWLSEYFGYDSVEWMWSLYYKLPQMVAAILIILLGVHFMRGGKKNISGEEITPYHREESSCGKGRNENESE